MGPQVDELPPGFEVVGGPPGGSGLPPGFNVAAPEAAPEQPGFWDRTGVPAAIRSVFTGYGLMNQVPGAIADISRQGRNPIAEWSGQMGHGLVESMKGGADRASQEHVNESLVARAIHTAVGATPVVGPMVEAVGEDLRSGNWKGLLGTITGALAPAALGPVSDAVNFGKAATETSQLAKGPLRAAAESVGVKPRGGTTPFAGASVERPLAQRINPFSPSDEAWVAKRGIGEANTLLENVGAPKIGPEVTSAKGVKDAIATSLKDSKGFRPRGSFDKNLREIVGDTSASPADVGNVVSESVARAQARVRGQVGPQLVKGRDAAETVPIQRDLAANTLENAPEANVPAVRNAKSRIVGDPEAEGYDSAATFGEVNRAASDLSRSRAGKLAGEDLSAKIRQSLSRQDPVAGRKLASAEEEAVTRLAPFEKGGPAHVLSNADKFMPEAGVSESLANTTHWEQKMKSVGNDYRSTKMLREHVAHNMLGLGEDFGAFKIKWRQAPPATKTAIFGDDAAAIDSILDTSDKLVASNTSKLGNLQTVMDQYSPGGWGRRFVSNTTKGAKTGVALGGGGGFLGTGGGAYGAAIGATGGAVAGGILGGIGSIMGEVAGNPGAMLRLAKGFEDFARLGRPQGLINVISAAQRQQNKGNK